MPLACHLAVGVDSRGVAEGAQLLSLAGVEGGAMNAQGRRGRGCLGAPLQRQHARAPTPCIPPPVCSCLCGLVSFVHARAGEGQAGADRLGACSHKQLADAM